MFKIFKTTIQHQFSINVWIVMIDNIIIKHYVLQNRLNQKNLLKF